MNRTRVSVVVASALTILLVLGLFAALSVVVSGRASATSVVDAAVPSESSSSTVDPLMPGSGKLSDIKNVVLLLADDLDWAAFNEVPRLKALMDKGTTLSNFVVTDSLCCPSRTSILRSQFVHNHKVLSNVPQTGGGWKKFNSLHLQRDCLPTWLNAKGIATSLVGKYLNGFPKGAPSPTYVPPGFTNFITSVSLNQSYKGYNYVLNENGTLRKYGHAPSDYINDVLTAQATKIISTSTTPFFLELASYSPHTPAPVAPRHVGSHPGSQVPRTAAYNIRGVDEPTWLSKVPAIGPKRLANLDSLWTRRVEASESVADSYDALTAQLAASGHSRDTLIIVTSDNGYHVAAHRLATGKQTPYREDSVVPAVLIGPGIAAGAVISEMTSTVDLAPTIAQLQGVQPPGWIDGRSLLPLLDGSVNPAWRTGILTENLARTKPGDPDYELLEPPMFRALRTSAWLYVEYADGTVQLNDLINDPYEVNNVVRTTDPTIVAQLRDQLRALSTCAGPSCLVADSMPTPGAAIEATPLESASPSASASPTVSATASASPVG
jgi:N-acetylglucosamine-6-sulfatase